MTPKASPPGDMTGKEFARLRRKMGKGQHELAHELGIATHTVSRYETGALRIPRKIELALRYLVSRKRGQT